MKYEHYNLVTHVTLIRKQFPSVTFTCNDGINPFIKKSVKCPTPDEISFFGMKSGKENRFQCNEEHNTGKNAGAALE